MGTKMIPKSIKNSKKVPPEAFPERVMKKCRKSVDLGGPWTLKIELSSRREHSFQGFSWVAFGSHFGGILGSIWDSRGPLWSPRAPQKLLRWVVKFRHSFWVLITRAPPALKTPRHHLRCLATSGLGGHFRRKMK